jgi:hypothetical protein
LDTPSVLTRVPGIRKNLVQTISAMGFRRGSSRGPGGAQSKELRAMDVQKLGGRLGVEFAPSKSGEGLVEKRNG